MRNILSIEPVVLLPKNCSALTKRAVQVFLEEIEMKTGLILAVSEIYLQNRSNIVLATERELADAAPMHRGSLSAVSRPGREGYRIFTVQEGDGSYSVFAVGADERGVMFGMGRLLRELFLRKNEIALDILMPPISSTPKSTLRGHQLGYRDKQNTCPCWDQRTFDRYIRDLVLFGANAIEILPPRTDDYLFSREMSVHPMQMMCDLSEIIHSYGMDVWMWYPNLAEDYDDPEVMAAELSERETVFRRIPYVDAVLIPAGDPGTLRPDAFFSVTGSFAKVLHKYHPDATVWVAPQCFDPDDDWMPLFYKGLEQRPEWLYGVCYAPWNPDSLEEMAARIPEVYRDRIRLYPDITHNLDCQFAMYGWDEAFGIIEGRECSNTRPRQMKHIHNKLTPLTVGSLTYSEGIHDDVNKFVWLQQDWDPEQSCVQTLREYARYFISPELSELLAKGFLALEQNWVFEGALEENTTVDDTYRLWCSIDSMASSEVRENYRYQMGMLRALSDYYIRHKKIYDLENERRAVSILETACEENVRQVMRQAAGVLNLSADEPWDWILHDRILMFADSLREKCGIKLTTKRHGGQNWRRGAWVDMLDFPLNNALFMLGTMRELWNSDSDRERVNGICAMLARTDPGPGGIYWNAASKETAKYFKTGGSWQDDPELRTMAVRSTDLTGVQSGFFEKGTHRERLIPKEWFCRLGTNYAQPITAEFKLNPALGYRLRIVYVRGFEKDLSFRLVAGNGAEIHGELKKGRAQYEFALTPDMYADGVLKLTWIPCGHYSGVSLNELMLFAQ